MAAGRPSKYSKELGIEICRRISEGQSVRAICKDPDMPSAATVFFWLLDEDKKEFLEHYETARNIQAENMFEELLEIADIEEDIQKARLKTDIRKWYLSKVLPKKFGDKVQQEIGGVDGEKLIPDTFTSEEKAKLLSLLDDKRSTS